MNYDEEWYNKLNKPKYQPPAWVFAPVWTILYVLMTISFVLVLFSPFRWSSLLAYLFFFTQLVVNLEWTPVFFVDHDLRKAFLLCVSLDVLVFVTILLFFHISKFAGLLLLPYFFWCLFASLLSFEILELNEW